MSVLPLFFWKRSIVCWNLHKALVSGGLLWIWGASPFPGGVAVTWEPQRTRSICLTQEGGTFHSQDYGVGNSSARRSLSTVKHKTIDTFESVGQKRPHALLWNIFRMNAMEEKRRERHCILVTNTKGQCDVSVTSSWQELLWSFLQSIIHFSTGLIINSRNDWLDSRITPKPSVISIWSSE